MQTHDPITHQGGNKNTGRLSKEKATNMVQMWFTFEGCGVVLLFLQLQNSLSAAKREIKVFMACKSMLKY